ncbi:MAG: methyl-accepting chemotaxis protein [Bacteroidetes bacterium]|nr:methyl-accepting chemotaxis protein [Bacteroidota bacterium]
MKKLPIGTKILCSFIILLLFTFIVGIIAIRSINNINDDYTNSINSQVEPLKPVMELEVAFANVSRVSRAFVIRVMTEPSEYDKQKGRLLNLLDVMEERIDTLHNVFSEDVNSETSKQNILILSEIREHFSDFRPMVEKMIETAKTGNLTETVKLLDATVALANLIYDNIQGIYDVSLDAIREVTHNNAANANVSITEIIAIITFALIIGIIFAIVMTRIFSNQVRWYEAILDAFVDNPVSITDMNKNLVFLNECALKVLGKTKAETIGKNCGTIWGVDICKDERCGIEYLKCGKGKSTFNVGDAIFTTNASYIKDRKGNNIGHIEIVDNVSQITHLTEYNKQEVERLATNIKKMSAGDSNIDFTVGKPNQYTEEDYKNFNITGNNLRNVLEAIQKMVADITDLAKALHDGNIGFRMDPSKHSGYFKEIIGTVNNALNELTKPLQEAANVLQLMSTGDLTPRVNANEYKNDMQDFANYVNNLADSLTELISQLQEAIHTTASSTAEISATMETLSSALHKEVNQVDEIAASMEEMSRTVAENTNSANLTVEVAKQSGVKANDGSSIVNQTVKKMRDISGVVRASTDNIAKLNENSKKISEITNVINDIADQTNLLSLNAAIEAARAGEQGRGFAVVADSVGKLAVSTASATKEIAEMIKQIQNDTDSAVKVMEKGTTEVQSGIDLADNAGTSLNEILSGINELLNMINQIATASEEQTLASQRISQNITTISQVTAESARNIEDVASTTNELANMTESLTNLVSQFKIGETNSNKTKSTKLLTN